MNFRIFLIFCFSVIWLSSAALADGAVTNRGDSSPSIKAKITGTDKHGPVFDTTNVPKVTAEIIGADNIKGDDGKFYYRFTLRYSDKNTSYGYISVKKLELWYDDLNNIVGSVLEFTPGEAPTTELAKYGCSVINPKVIY